MLSAPRIALPLGEAAESVGLSLSSFRRHVLPEVKTIRVGSCVLVSTAELSKWADESGILNGTAR